MMKKWIILIAIIFIALISASTVIYVNANAPFKDAQAYAEDVARTKADMSMIDEIFLYNGSATFYVVTGKRNDGKDVIVWIPENKSDSIIVKNQSDGISKEEAIAMLMKEENPAKILGVRLGMERKLPIWELSYLDDRSKLNYYYIDFESGKWWRKIENL